MKIKTSGQKDEQNEYHPASFFKFFRHPATFTCVVLLMPGADVCKIRVDRQDQGLQCIALDR